MSERDREATTTHGRVTKILPEMVRARSAVAPDIPPIPTIPSRADARAETATGTIGTQKTATHHRLKKNWRWRRTDKKASIFKSSGRRHFDDILRSSGHSARIIGVLRATPG